MRRPRSSGRYSNVTRGFWAVWNRQTRQSKIGNPQRPMPMFLTIVSNYSIAYLHWLTLVLIGHYFESRLEDKNPIILFAAFIIIVLNVFGGLVRDWASIALKLQIELLTLSFGGPRGDNSANNWDLLNSFPWDIRTARKIFDLEAMTKVYVACSGCSTLYPVEGKQLLVHCNWRRYPNT